MLIKWRGRNVNVSVERIHLPQDKMQWRILINKVMNLQFPYKTTTFDRLCQCHFLWKRSEACSYEENTGDLGTGIPPIQPCCKNKLMTFWSTRHICSLFNRMPWNCATWQSGHWLIERHFGCCVSSVGQRNFGCQLSLRCRFCCGCITYRMLEPDPSSPTVILRKLDVCLSVHRRWYEERDQLRGLEL